MWNPADFYCLGLSSRQESELGWGGRWVQDHTLVSETRLPVYPKPRSDPFQTFLCAGSKHGLENTAPLSDCGSGSLFLEMWSLCGVETVGCLPAGFAGERKYPPHPQVFALRPAGTSAVKLCLCVLVSRLDGCCCSARSVMYVSLRTPWTG